MLYQQFDYTVAYFKDAASIDPAEYQAADVVTIGEYHPKGIYHSTHMRWLCQLQGKTSSEIIRSPKERSKLQKNRDYFLNQGYTFEIKRMNEADFHEFNELYENTTQKKERAIRHSTASSILGRLMVGIPVYCVGMYQEGKLASGLVFSSETKDTIVVSYGAKRKFQEVSGGVGGTLEWELLKYCEANNIKSISHGRNSNPVGLMISAGLFEFKARYGNSAYPEGSWVTTFLRNPAILISDMIVVSTINDRVGYTIISDHPVAEKKYITNEVNNIRLLSLTKVVEDARSAF